MPELSPLAEKLLREQQEIAEKERARRQEQYQSRVKPEIDPYSTTNWRTVAGPELPAPMPTTPMRMGTVGFWISCRCCGSQFESKGLAFCEKCMELPAEERHKAPPFAAKRACANCGKALPYRKRAGVLFCSKECRQQAAYYRRLQQGRRLSENFSTDNGAQLPDSAAPDFPTDNGKKDQ
jgi:hypothetical protein